MPIRIYGYPGCTTVRRGCEWADTHKIEAEYAHFSKVPNLRRELTEWVKVAGIERVFNMRSQTFRKLADEDRAKIEANDEARIAAMAADPRLIKRPVATDGEVVLTGFDEKEWTAAFG
ncbi:arsenate reductase family protein [Oricola cellulosilytica]|uniref:Arsenate reductase n=1 Tax=Oricola cellulosilytica TaxID=1429082 RepID=A0A4R0PJY8_9HYPH|nr:ArsC/Spx/MgsR family protein [Oricola cellulosilytica]TCD15969.1 arsenate reductase [Oricola cellulosilytica]